MPTATKIYIDRIEDVEEEGVIVHSTFYFMVYNLSNTNGDRRTLDEALATSGIPVLGNTAPGNTNLALYRRTPRPLPDSPTKVEIKCEYKTVADYENSFIFSGGTSLSQVQTDVDYYGNPIQLSYTYPANYYIPALAGETISERMNETVFVPRTVLTATGSLYVNYPDEISQGWAWHVNSTAWANKPAGYWLCTSCDFTARDVGLGRPHLWKFTWTFELEPRDPGWPVVAKIRDPNTGNIPFDAVQGTGVKNVTWYPSRDFNELFGNT